MKIPEYFDSPKNVRVTIMMHPELKSILDSMVKAYGSNMSSFINMLIILINHLLIDLISQHTL